MYFNARSLLPKIDDLRAEVLSKNPSVVCVVESWLSRDVLDLEITLLATIFIGMIGIGIVVELCCMLILL